MNVKIFLAMLLFLFCINSALATGITSCLQIDSSGYYQFSQNITTNATWCGSETSCIYINASDVELWLDGYGLIDNAGCQYGITVNAKNPDPTIIFENIKIQEGMIEGFHLGGIRLVGSNTTTINALSITNYGTGDGVRLDAAFNEYLSIQNNRIETGDHAISGSCSQSCEIKDNTLLSFNGLYLNGFGFDIQNNYIGLYSDNSGDSTKNDRAECVQNGNQMTNSIECDFCGLSTIQNNVIYAQNGLNVHDDAYNNTFSFNSFILSGNTFTPATFSADTENNTFCSNNLVDNHLEIVNIADWFGTIVNITCWWKKTNTNAYTFVSDAGSNTISSDCANNCITGYACINDTKVLYDNDCNILARYSCEYGCLYGQCYGSQTAFTLTTISTTTTSITPVSGWGINMTQSIINQTDLSDAGIMFIAPFFTPLFLIATFNTIISGLLSALTKNMIVFPICFLVLTLVLGYMGVFTVWITAVFGVACALGIGLMLKNMVQ